MEFCFLLISRILGVGVNSLFLKSFFDNFTFDESFSPPEVSQTAHDFRVGRHYILLDVELLWPEIVLDPRSAVFLIGGVVEAALGCAGEGILA